MPGTTSQHPSALHCDAGIVVAAAGSARRYGPENKLFAELRGHPVFLHCLLAAHKVVPVDSIVLVVNAAERATFRQALAAHASLAAIRLIAGGDTRAHSVRAGLRHLPGTCVWAAVLDAARPLQTPELIERCLDTARRHGSGIAAKPVAATVKEAGADGRVVGTLDRSRLWTTETPQAARTATLVDAYDDLIGRAQTATDEAEVLEKAGCPVQLVRWTAPNPKLTFPGDLPLLRALCASLHA